MKQKFKIKVTVIPPKGMSEISPEEFQKMLMGGLQDEITREIDRETLKKMVEMYEQEKQSRLVFVQDRTEDLGGGFIIGDRLAAYHTKNKFAVGQSDKSRDATHSLSNALNDYFRVGDMGRS